MLCGMTGMPAIPYSIVLTCVNIVLWLQPDDQKNKHMRWVIHNQSTNGITMTTTEYYSINYKALQRSLGHWDVLRNTSRENLLRWAGLNRLDQAEPEVNCPEPSLPALYFVRTGVSKFWILFVSELVLSSRLSHSGRPLRLRYVLLCKRMYASALFQITSASAGGKLTTCPCPRHSSKA